MNTIDDLKLVYKKALRDLISRLKDNPLFLIVPFIYLVLFQVVNMIFGRYISPMLGILGGFITPIIYSLILASYFSVLDDLINYNKIYFKNITTSFKRYFGSVYSAYIILILISWLTASISQISNLTIFINLILLIVFNCLAETIYIRGEYYLEAYKYSYNFIRENHLLWFIPFLIYLIILRLVGIELLYYIFNSNIIDIPIGSVPLIAFSSSINIVLVIKLFIFSVITGVYALFRGVLFKILYKSSKRKRAYMGEL